MRLNQIKKDGLFRVLDLNSNNACISRLMSMGLLPGQEIRLVHKAPLGDPIAIEFNGCHMSLRLIDAAEIEVEKVQ
ncbi:FeoA family protein [Coraliomargarita parva]|uniref:FeoA family protein n=1 Tax=Coraliomargarita parva TaxID=3014050 RepID=UPI0022B543B5|nr:FeoA family protein [Coraliomargarita parva]